MKKLAVLLFALILVVACKEKTQTDTESLSEAKTEMETREVSKSYPEAVAGIFDAHGGIDHWNAMNSLQFKFEGRSGTEMNTVSLKDRRSLVETDAWAIGNDGANVWLDVKEGEYKGNARFYHNLFFYFYAMPFIVADDGITYSDVEATELPDGTYPGVKISYGAGVGDSPEDEYIIFYDPDTHAMKWLGYTVTYNTGEKSEKWNYIKYDEWNEVNGLVLPKKLAWYNVEEGAPTTERNAMEMETVSINESNVDDSIFAMREGAQAVEK